MPDDFDRRRKPGLRKRIRDMLGVASGLSLLGGAALASHGGFRLSRSMSRANSLLAGLKKTPYEKLIEEGVLPRNARIVTGRNVGELAKELLKLQGRRYSGASDTLKRILEDNARAEAKVYLGGGNAAYMHGLDGSPLFIGPAEGMARDIAAHEAGHYAAARRFGDLVEYGREIERLRKVSPEFRHMFGKGMWRESDGRLSLPGREREAWDLAPVKTDSRIRKAAINSYLEKRMADAESKYGGLGMAGGLAGLLARTMMPEQ